jgi:hypothetical protein
MYDGIPFLSFVGQKKLNLLSFQLVISIVSFFVIKFLIRFLVRCLFSPCC